MHQRTLIRQAFQKMLSGRTEAGERVFSSTFQSVFPDQLPAIFISTGKEDVSILHQAPLELERKLEVAVTAAYAEAEALDEALDHLAEQIEQVLSEDETLGGVAMDSILTSVEPEIDAEGAVPVGYITLTFSVTYRTPWPADLETGKRGLGEFSGIKTEIRDERGAKSETEGNF